MYEAARSSYTKGKSVRSQQMFLRFEGQIHDSSHSVSTECEVYRIEEGDFVQQILIARAKFFAMREGKRTKPSILCAQNARFKSACKSVLSG